MAVQAGHHAAHLRMVVLCAALSPRSRTAKQISSVLADFFADMLSNFKSNALWKGYGPQK